MVTLFSVVYSILWFSALPLLRIPGRLRRGWKQRLVQGDVSGPFDIWLQAASGGEALIGLMLLEQLSQCDLSGRLKILATSGTPEGVETLARAKQSGIEVQTAYFPFDAPFLMQRAFTAFSPKMAVIIETELWPGFLINAEKQGVPVVLVNGRMSEKSFRWYRFFRRFFQTFGPDRILAVSEADRTRFAALVGAEKTALMQNIKFDRIPSQQERPDTAEAVAGIAAGPAPFIIFGSIRREEEKEILATVKRIMAEMPDAVIGIFPKHLKRVNHWLNALGRAGIPAVAKSAMQDPDTGLVIVWDSYGELAAAYARADAAFVGGSLADLGGQNFLEPLVSGLRPCIGPYWKNFSWIGEEVITSGLVRQVGDAGELAETLLAQVRNTEERDLVRQEVRLFLKTRQGGTDQACKTILTLLKSLPVKNNE